MIKPIIGILAVIVGVAVPGWGGVIVINSSPDIADATIYDNQPTHNGGAGDLRIGRTTSAGSRRVLLRFDLSAVPAGAVVDTVTLQMVVTMVPPGFATPAPGYLHRVGASWVEGTSSAGGGGGAEEVGAVSWNAREHGVLDWSAPGGDFAPAASANTIMPDSVGGTAVWTSPQMVADVQDWVDNPASNHGWILIGDEGVPKSVRQFSSREGANPPALTISYTLPSPPASNSVGLLPYD